MLVEILQAEGFVAFLASTADEAVDKVRRLRPDVLLLDLGLGSGNGFDVLRTLGRDAAMGIIVVSGHDGESDRVAGLELGADDFVTKPFMRRELVARVRAVIRRSGTSAGSAQPDVREFGSLVIDDAAMEARVDGHSVNLTAREFDLLSFLAASPRRVFSRDQILERVWGSSQWRASGTVAEHVRRVRQKLAAGGSDHDWIATLKGAGYRFEPVATGAAGHEPGQLPPT